MLQYLFKVLQNRLVDYHVDVHFVSKDVQTSATSRASFCVLTRTAAPVQLSSSPYYELLSAAWELRNHQRTSHMMNNWMVSRLYEFLIVLSAGQIMQKTLDKEYNWMVSLLYEFLNVFSAGYVVQKTLDKEYTWMVSQLYEFLNVLSDC
jgi:hypothetical protein